LISREKNNLAHRTLLVYHDDITTVTS